MDCHLYCPVKLCNTDVSCTKICLMVLMCHFLSLRSTGAEGLLLYSLFGFCCLTIVLSFHYGLLHLPPWYTNRRFCAASVNYLQHPFHHFLLMVKSYPRPITSNGINGCEKFKEEATRCYHNTKSSHDLSVVTFCLGPCCCQNKENLA